MITRKGESPALAAPAQGWEQGVLRPRPCGISLYWKPLNHPHTLKAAPRDHPASAVQPMVLLLAKLC
jgi:hypothetical protein